MTYILDQILFNFLVKPGHPTAHSYSLLCIIVMKTNNVIDNIVHICIKISITIQYIFCSQ